MNIKLSKIISAILIICICTCFIASCNENKISTENNGEYLKEILSDYRNNGMNCWQDILAVYNANENPLDYRNFDETLALYDQSNYESMIGYCLIVDAAVIIGADEVYFENYQPYLKKLRALIEKMDGGEEVTPNLYALAYYALKGGNISFDDSKFIYYILSAVNLNDAEQTAMFIPAAVNFAKSNPDDSGIKNWLDDAAKCIEMAKNSDNTFNNSLGNKSALATSSALGSLISYHYYYNNSSDVGIINSVYSALSLFKAKKDVGYSDLINKTDAPDMNATAFAAMAISSMANNMSIWDKFMEEAKEVEPAV